MIVSETIINKKGNRDMKKKFVRAVSWLGVFALFLMTAPHAKATVAYTITDLGTLGGFGSIAYGINNSGQIVGNAVTSNNEMHPFIYENGIMTDLIADLPQGLARGINESGQIFGNIYSRCTDPGLSTCAFIYDGTTVTEIVNLTGASIFAMGIGPSGQLVGVVDTHLTAGIWDGFVSINGTLTELGNFGGTQSYAFGANDDYAVGAANVTGDLNAHAFAYEFATETMTDLGTLGGSYSMAAAINDAGQIAGGANTQDEVTHVFIYDNGIMTDLGVLGEGNNPTAMNSLGEIVGDYFTSGNYRAFGYVDDQLQDLNDLIDPESGWILEYAYDINDSGQIVGQGIIDGEYHAYLLDPVTN